MSTFVSQIERDRQSLVLLPSFRIRLRYFYNMMKVKEDNDKKPAPLANLAIAFEQI